MGCGCGVFCHRRLQALDSFEIAAALRRREAECHACANGGGDVARRDRLGVERCQLLFCGRDVAVEPELELCIREPQFAIVDVANVAARLEVLDRHAELLRELSQRLDRRRARARLDPRDVRVRHPGRREVALRQIPLETEALEARADRLCRTSGHAGPDHEKASDISQIVNRCFLVAT